MCPVQIQPSQSQQQSEFARLFEESAKQAKLKEGEIVKGRVVRIGRDQVIVDIGFKSEGQIPIEEFKNARGELTAEIGKEIEVLLRGRREIVARALKGAERPERSPLAKG